MVERISRDEKVTIGQFLNEKSGYGCSKCGFFSPSRKSVEEHASMKHHTGDAKVTECHATPAIRPREGEGDDPTTKMELDRILQSAQPKHGSWTREDAEETGRRWHREIMAQWQQGVQEKQISREESRRIRKDGAFPIFIKDNILPMWKAWKGVSFGAIQGLYEMSLQMERMKMHQLRNEDKELYGPRKKLDAKQLEARMKASKAARRIHQILK
jgi:hypothetical protein